MAVILLSVAASSCAKQGAPTGGPKDTEPPVALSQNPPNRSLNFTAEKVTLTFNEFVQLKDPAKEIFVSPPMRTKPEYKASGKNIIILFKEPLKPDATYTINFGKAIADFTEGNPLTNYEYVFSTGDRLDSLSVSGKVLNAFNLQPEPDLVAMVYMDDNDTIPLDSLPLKVPPKSASRTIKDGSFRINNLPPGEYLLFALQDLNNNFIFDLPNEKIAFLDSLVTLRPPSAPDTAGTITDSLAELLPPLVDTVKIAIDTLIPETPEAIIITESQYTMYLFEEVSTIQRLLGKKLIGENLLTYQFRLPVDSFHISLVNHEPERPDWYLPDISKKRDTLNFWLRAGLPDTLRIRLSYGDTLADTSRFIIAKGQDRPGRRKSEAASSLKISSNAFAGALDLGKEPALFFSSPVASWDTSRMILATNEDTLHPSIFFPDTLLRKAAVIKYNLQPGDIFRIVVLDSAFTDISGNANDSTGFGFKMRKPEEYGLLMMNMMVPEEESSYIIQLMTEKEFIISEKIINNNGMISFGSLRPGKYKLKAIHDKNANGQWDVGEYISGKLPESVAYYPLPIEIRANWELQEEWKLFLP